VTVRPALERGRRRLGSGGLALVVGLWLCGAAASAEERPLSVVLTITGPADEVAALRASVGELLARLAVRVVPQADAPLARVTVTLGEQTCWASVINGAGEVVSDRQVPRGPSSQVTLEAVALVVQSAVEALAELERHPVARRVRQPKPTPPPRVESPRAEPSPARSRPALGLEVGAVGSGRGFGEGAAFVLGGGLVVSVRGGPSRWSPVGSFLATYNGPFSRASDVVEVSAQSFSLRVLGGARLSPAERWAFELLGGGGMDGLVPAGRSTTLPVTALAPPHVEASPVLTALLGARYAPTETTAVFVGVSADVDLLPRRLVAEVQGTREVLFEAWRVRPAVMVGFSFDVLGRPAP
jgi:hypothetical protein